MHVVTHLSSHISNSNEEQKIKELRCLGCYSTRLVLLWGTMRSRRGTQREEIENISWLKASGTSNLWLHTDSVVLWLHMQPASLGHFSVLGSSNSTWKEKRIFRDSHLPDIWRQTGKSSSQPGSTGYCLAHVEWHWYVRATLYLYGNTRHTLVISVLTSPLFFQIWSLLDKCFLNW